MKFLTAVKSYNFRDHLRNQDISKELTLFSIINRIKEISKLEVSGGQIAHPGLQVVLNNC